MATPGGFHLLSSSVVENDLQLPVSSNAVTLGDMLELDVGAANWTDADASTEHWQLKAVATETVASSATAVMATLVVPGQVWACETANNSAAADNGDRMLLTDTNTVNNTGTDNTSEEACVVQLTPMGTAADLRIRGVVVPGIGINPDAT